MAANKCTIFNNTDFYHNDLSRANVISFEDCCDRCADAVSEGCKAWTFIPPNNCFLKSSAAGKRSFNNYVSGILGSLPPTPPTPAPPTPIPVPRGGGKCSRDWDCSLAGTCTNELCVCDSQYTGLQCGVLRFRRAKLDNGLSNSTALHTWGGHAIKDSKSGNWVGFFSYMAAGCDLNTWQGNSMIIKAAAKDPDGPYNLDLAPVTGPWTHNAMISQHPNGTYFLFHIGSGTHQGLKNCSSKPDPFYPFPSGHSEPPKATTHASESLDGPWREAPGVPGINNPAPLFFANGTTLIYGRTDVTWADSIDGPWLPQNHKTTVPVAGNMVPEDPFVWRDHRGYFHMLFNANSGHSHCPATVPCGGHAWSLDGLTWSKPKIPAFGTILHFQDNTTAMYDYVERPQIVQHPDGTGAPYIFFAGHGYSNVHNLAVMFCQDSDKDEDCVTMIQ